MTSLASAFAAWDRAVALGTDATAADWSAVADAWRACSGCIGAAQRIDDAMCRARYCARRDAAPVTDDERDEAIEDFIVEAGHRRAATATTYPTPF